MFYSTHPVQRATVRKAVITEKEKVSVKMTLAVSSWIDFRGRGITFIYRVCVITSCKKRVTEVLCCCRFTA